MNTLFDSQMSLGVTNGEDQFMPLSLELHRSHYFLMRFRGTSFLERMRGESTSQLVFGRTLGVLTCWTCADVYNCIV
uniref:Uncharacterized protein n=1 Tax=Solanum lycopersicum TaxID=4081 RepID=A0A3Q7FBT1_SOLLC